MRNYSSIIRYIELFVIINHTSMFQLLISNRSLAKNTKLLKFSDNMFSLGKVFSFFILHLKKNHIIQKIGTHFYYYFFLVMQSQLLNIMNCTYFNCNIYLLYSNIIEDLNIETGFVQIQTNHFWNRIYTCVLIIFLFTLVLPFFSLF